MRVMGRSLLRVLLLIAILGGVGAAVELSTASASSLPAATSATPGVPTTTIKSVNGDTATVCVENYGPNTTVTLLNKANNATGVIHTDATGAGCTTMHLNVSCTQTLHETMVATGVDAKGAAATSQAIADVPPGGTGCGTSSPTPTPSDDCPRSGQLILSIYIAPQGSFVRAIACGFLPGESAAGFVFSSPQFLGNTTADADGQVTMRTKIPNCIPPGQHTFQLVGETSNHSASAQFSVTKSAACPKGGSGVGKGGVRAGGGVLPGVDNQGGGPTGGLAFTGANILLMVLIALVLLVLGILAVATVRRRRAAPAA